MEKKRREGKRREGEKKEEVSRKKWIVVENLLSYRHQTKYFRSLSSVSTIFLK